MCWKGFCVTVEFNVISQNVVRNCVFTTQITIKMCWKGFSQQCGVVVFSKSHRLHLHLHCELSNAFSNCRPEYMLNHTCCICLTFLHCVFSNVSSNSWEDIKSHWLHLFDFFVFLNAISNCQNFPNCEKKNSHTGCDFSPLCVSNVSSNVDEAFVFPFADHPHSLARFVNLVQWWKIWWLRFYTYRWHPTIFV